MSVTEEHAGVLEGIVRELGIESPCIERGNVVWLPTEKLNVREVALAMKARAARFVTITATELPGTEGFLLEYLWDLHGSLIGFPFRISDKSFESIYDICEASDWIEREIYEGYALELKGREYEPLLLRAKDKPGVNLREGVR